MRRRDCARSGVMRTDREKGERPRTGERPRLAGRVYRFSTQGSTRVFQMDVRAMKLENVSGDALQEDELGRQFGRTN